MKALVVVVCLLILMMYLSVNLTVILPQAYWYFHTTLGFLHYMFVHMVLFCTMYAYYRIVSTPPGEIPALWVPTGFTDEELEAAKLPSKAPRGKRPPGGVLSKPRYCGKCCRYKPPRAHHCSICDRCVPRMDHHCPWVNNCVGNGNHKLFINFLFWGVFGILYGNLLMLIRVAFMFRSIIIEAPITLTPIQGCVIALNFILLLPIVLGMISLCCWQVNLAGMNSTTIEYHEKRFKVIAARRKKRKFRWPYDFGVPGNFSDFFGPSYIYWCVPVLPSNLGNGLEYRMALGATELEELLEQERQDAEEAERAARESAESVEEVEEVGEAGKRLTTSSLTAEDRMRLRGEDRVLNV